MTTFEFIGDSSPRNSMRRLKDRGVEEEVGARSAGIFLAVTHPVTIGRR